MRSLEFSARSKSGGNSHADNQVGLYTHLGSHSRWHWSPKIEAGKLSRVTQSDEGQPLQAF